MGDDDDEQCNLNAQRRLVAASRRVLEKLESFTVQYVKNLGLLSPYN
jgi:hypothetical protein